MERLSLLKTPSDSLALVEIPHHPFRPDTAQRELVLALDQVQNPGNLGTIIRLADWFGIPEIVCSPTTADCYNPEGRAGDHGDHPAGQSPLHGPSNQYLASGSGAEYSRLRDFPRGENIYFDTPLRRAGSS